MNTLGLLVLALMISSSWALSTREGKASRERKLIMNKLESLMTATVSSMSTVASRLEKIEADQTEMQETMRDYASRFDAIESQLSVIQQEQHCSLPAKVFRQNGNHLYMLGLSRLNWAQARERCHQCGYSLARIESDDEQQYIHKWLMDIDAKKLASPDGSTATIWMDGTDHGHEGCWVWTYPNVALFLPGNTDWNRSNSGGNEHCNSLIYGLDSKWIFNDINCNIDRIFLCEKVTKVATPALPSLDEIRDTSLC